MTKEQKIQRIERTKQRKDIIMSRVNRLSKYVPTREKTYKYFFCMTKVFIELEQLESEIAWLDNYPADGYPEFKNITV